MAESAGRVIGFPSPDPGGASIDKSKKKKKKKKKAKSKRANKDENKTAATPHSSGSGDEFFDCSEGSPGLPARTQKQKPPDPPKPSDDDVKIRENVTERGAGSESPINDAKKLADERGEEPMDCAETSTPPGDRAPKVARSPPASANAEKQEDKSQSERSGKEDTELKDTVKPPEPQKDSSPGSAPAAKEGVARKRGKKRNWRDRRSASSEISNSSKEVHPKRQTTPNDHTPEVHASTPEVHAEASKELAGLPQGGREDGNHHGGEQPLVHNDATAHGQPDIKQTESPRDGCDTGHREHPEQPFQPEKTAGSRETAGGRENYKDSRDECPHDCEPAQQHKDDSARQHGNDSAQQYGDWPTGQHSDRSAQHHGDHSSHHREESSAWQQHRDRPEERPDRRGAHQEEHHNHDRRREQSKNLRRGDREVYQGGFHREPRGPREPYQQEHPNKGHHYRDSEDWKRGGRENYQGGHSGTGQKTRGGPGQQGTDRNRQEGVPPSRRQGEERPKYTVGEALDRKEKFAFFFRGGSPFSQWHWSKFRVAGRKFVCAEQFMMYQKAMLFGDEETAELILDSEEPRVQKQLGRQVKNFDEEVWSENCRDIVYQGNLAKFRQNARLRKVLLETVDMTLVEASPYDQIWGIGLEADDPRAVDRSQWEGDNLLGQILTDVREQIIREEREGKAEEARISQETGPAGRGQGACERDGTAGGPLPKLNRDFAGRREYRLSGQIPHGQLITKNDRGEQFEFFYGHGHPFGLPYHCQFTVGENTFNSAEHYMYYCKAIKAGCEDDAERILREKDPNEQKKLSKKANKKLAMKDWNDSYLPSVLFDGNMAKFSQNRGLGDRLLDTGKRILALSDLPRDDFWSIGLSSSDPLAKQMDKWRGKNVVGDVLMKVRAKLLQERGGRGERVEKMDTSTTPTKQSGPSPT